MTENQKDITLLRSDPHALIVKYQATIRIIARKFIWRESSGLEDLIQTINEGLLAKIATIQKSYNGRSSVATYLSAIIWNICRGSYKASKHGLELLGDFDLPDPDTSSLSDAPAVSQAARALEEVVDLVPAERSRLIILLPLHFKVPLTRDGIDRAYPRCKSKQVRTLLQTLGGNISLKNEYDIYSLVTPFLNDMEKRSTSADGYRHWLSEKIPEVIMLLNARLGGASFGKETLQILIEKISIQNLPDK